MRSTSVLLLLLTSILAGGYAHAGTFRFHLPVEPTTLDPAQLKGSEASYFFSSLYTGLYKFHSDKGLIPVGASHCKWHGSLRLTCKLNPKRRWSDGTQVVASDYVRSFRHLMDPHVKTYRSNLLENLAFAKSIQAGQKPLTDLGIRAQGPLTLEFLLSRPDPELKYKLAAIPLVPIPASPIPTIDQAVQLKSNGPYEIQSWERGHLIKLKPNPYFPGYEHRPNVEVLFIHDDETALTLYEKGELTFLRRLPTEHIPDFEKRPDFIQIPVSRFDYLGFSSKLDHLKQLRKAMSLSLNYEELKVLLHALGRPGCPSIPASYMDHVVCLSENLPEARKAWALVPEWARHHRWKIEYSSLGGEDHRRVMEWMQNQWQKNLGLKVQVQQQEQRVFVARLKHDQPEIFRKGVGLNRPTCLAALEVFSPESAENYIHLNDPAYNKILFALGKRQSASMRRKLCRQGVEILLQDYRVIPMGRIHFSLLADPHFKGWELNEMNQLDLTDLREQTGN